MLLSAFLAAAVLLFFFGLLWPEKAKWLKWLTGLVGALGTLLVVALLRNLWSVEGLPVVEGETVERGLYLISVILMELMFWGPGIGLGIGRISGRWVRKVGQNVQQTIL